MDRRMFSGLLVGAAVTGGLMPRAALADSPRLHGVVVYRERMALPPDAVLEIQLLDVGRADAPAKVIARYQAPAGPGSPIAFSMPVARARIRTGTTAALRARILVGGQLWFTSTDRILLPEDPAAKLTIPVQRVAAQADAGTGPQGDWLVEDILGGGVLDGPPAQLTIAADGAVSGTGGCNRMAGKAEIKGDHIRFGRLISTQMACIGAAMEQDARLAEALDRARSFRLIPQERKLLILDGAGKTVLRAARQG